ncbi:GAF and ANTAR domain-containing protein [Paenarthrobacter sp. NPDC089322]|uniref:GAF and ANTAR domain-containing protein n=1 Tax=Paenarthrobacter sp. NPDC089322 TaxID=3155065 RepID=UPI0034288087
METDEQNEDFQRLHQLVAGTDDIKGFLDGTTRYAATTLSRATGSRIECAVTLHRRKRAVTIAGSSDEAILLDGIEQALGDGPCMEALRILEPVLLDDVRTDKRWPRYAEALESAGTRSVLGIPLSLGQDASGALNFFAPEPGLFSREAIEEAAIFGDMAGQAMRLALRIAAADLLAEDLKAAMERRTAIDLACGMIMSQSQCTQEEAFAFLLKASQHRNEKVHDVAEGIIRGRAGGAVTTFFDD